MFTISHYIRESPPDYKYVVRLSTIHVHIRLIILTRKGGSRDALQRSPTLRQPFPALITMPIMHLPTNLTILQEIFANWWTFISVLAKFVLHIRRNCYFRASDQNSGITVRFSDPVFLKENSTSAIRWRF